MSDISQYNFPTTIRFGTNVVKELPAYLKRQGLAHPLIVSDPGCIELPFFKSIVADLESKKLSVTVYSGISKNPIKSDVHSGAEVFNQNQCDCVIGLGGGASMDVARAVALKANHSEDLFHYEETVGGDQHITNPIPHFITIPTTSGTGSEVGRSSIISDDETHEKKILFHPNLLAKIVFADPALTLGLPPFITAATGIDALTHNIEAYVAKMWHPMCEGIALEGIKLIERSLVKAVKASDIKVRADMMIGSLMGAVAFQKGLGVVHSLAHPMSTLFDTHHGLANALNLPFGVRFNQATVPEKTKVMANIFQTDNLFQSLLDLNGECGIPEGLSSQGVKASDIDGLSDLALADFCHPNNPRPVTLENFKQLYKEAL